MSRLFKKFAKAQPLDREPGRAYDSLPEGDYIRYLVLFGGVGNEPLVCNLHAVALRKVPSFEAVSYVWGSDIKDHEITCNGEAISITNNLWDVLRRVRLPAESRTVWADSICINQKDEEEKRQQVLLMGKIYSTAAKVLIYLGEDPNGHGPAAASLVSELDSMISRVIKKGSHSFDVFPYPDPQEREKLLKDQRWDSFFAASDQPWFSRGWVVQEVGLAKESVVIWGITEMSWRKFIRAHIWITRRFIEVKLRLPGGDKVNALHLEMYRLRHIWETMPLHPSQLSRDFHFLSILQSARLLSLTLNKDRIYAFLAFTRESSIRLNLPADTFHKDAINVYFDFARQYIKSTDDLELLHYIQHNQTSIDDPIPSWVPRWDINQHDATTTKHSSGEILKAQTYAIRPSVSSEGHLKVCAVLFDSVSFKTDLLRRSISVDEVRSIWRRGPGSQTVSPYLPTHRPTAFAMAFVLGRDYGNAVHWEECRDAFMHLLEMDGHYSDDSKEQKDVKYYHEAIRTCAHGRRFIVTRQGYYGLAPHAVLENDICAVIFGTKSPFILRATTTPGCYKVIGDVLVPSKRFGDKVLVPGAQSLFALGQKGGEDWVDLGLEERDIHLC